MSTQEEIIEVIKKIKGSNIEINIYDSLVEKIGLSSFEMILLICDLESNINRKISFSKITNSTTIQDLSQIIDESGVLND